MGRRPSTVRRLGLASRPVEESAADTGEWLRTAPDVLARTALRPEQRERLTPLTAPPAVPAHDERNHG